MSVTQKNSRLIEENMGLVHACANRFRGRGVEYDDLFQSGCVGLIKAAEGFDSSLGYCFSTYAVPAILGEIRRIFRDGGSVKIGRSAKEKARLLMDIKERLAEQNGREPSVSEIASAAGTDIFTAAQLLSASLPTLSLTSGDDESEADIPTPAPEESLAEKIDLNKALQSLEKKEKDLITLRFYKGMTQSKTAEVLGMTQVQVSRREKAILLKLRKIIE